MKIHFIGSAGVSMSWLASYFESRGDVVTGSDVTTGGHCAENVDGADIVVYTSAIPADNEELVAAKRQGIKTVPRAELLGEVSREFERVIAISGTHGKTTVTGMLGRIDPSAALHIGGSVTGETRKVDGNTLICEACEYKASFLHLKRDIAVVLNAEFDHPDFYADRESVITAFAQFAAGADTLVTTPKLSQVLIPKQRTVTVGEGGDCFVSAFSPGKHIELSLWGRRMSFKTPLIGRHNAYNLAFAAATSALSGIADDEIAYGLSGFHGVDRRLQTVGRIGKTAIISDYAHHPQEITASLDAVKHSGRKKILAVFQPHTYSRLNTFFGGFVKSLKVCDCIILPVFAAREAAVGNDSKSLCAALRAYCPSCVCAADFAAAEEMIRRRAADYNAVVIMGAGDVDKLAARFKE